MADLSAADAKIHILYIAGHVPGISYHMLMDKCLSSLYMDFFTFSKAYQELINGNLMDVPAGENGMGEAIGGTEQLNLSAGGLAVLEDITPSINFEVLQHLDAACTELNAKIRELARFKASTEPSGDGVVTVKLTSDNMNIDIKCEDPSLAEKISCNWRLQGQDLVYSILT